MPPKNSVPPPPPPGNTAWPNYSQPSPDSVGSADSARPTGTGTGFFGWVRTLGLVRQNGWIGGVCGSIAARLGIDPIIVRGIGVVVAVLGGPAFLFYAAGWLLLPDIDDRIHLERLIRGRFEPAVIGVAVVALLTLLPFSQGFWWSGTGFWNGPHWAGSLFSVLWSIAIIALIVAFVVWAVRRANWSSRGGDFAYSSRMASASAAAAAPGNPAATPGDPTNTQAPNAQAPNAQAPDTESPGTQAPNAQASDVSGATFTSSATTPTTVLPEPPTAPRAPGPGTSGDDFEAWKNSQAAWKEQHAAWTQQQRADQRAIREQRSAELRAQSQFFAAERAENRRVKRLANPRTSAAYVFAVIGLALVAGAIAGGISSTSAMWDGYELTTGFAVATLVFALAIVAAGLTRRRSGFLSFVSIVLVLFTVASALVPRDGELLFPATTIRTGASSSYVQPAGTIYSEPRSAYDAPGEQLGPQIVNIEQAVGAMIIRIDGDHTVRVQTVQHYEQELNSGNRRGDRS